MERHLLQREIRPRTMSLGLDASFILWRQLNHCRNSRGLRNVAGSSFVRCYTHFREGIREEVGSFVFQEFILVSKVT